MSTDLERTRLLAERIARRVGASPGVTSSAAVDSPLAAEIAALRSDLSALENKLVQLEAKILSDPSPPSGHPLPSVSAERVSTSPVLLTHSPWLAGVNVHPSEEKFQVEEAVVSELVDFFEKEKTCSVEPGGKPCDHCAMCSSRGF